MKIPENYLFFQNIIFLCILACSYMEAYALRPSVYIHEAKENIPNVFGAEYVRIC